MNKCPETKTIAAGVALQYFREYTASLYLGRPRTK